MRVTTQFEQAIDELCIQRALSTLISISFLSLFGQPREGRRLIRPSTLIIKAIER